MNVSQAHVPTLVPGLGGLGRVGGRLEPDDVHVAYAVPPAHGLAVVAVALEAEARQHARALRHLPGEVILHAAEEERHPRV